MVKLMKNGMVPLAALLIFSLGLFFCSDSDDDSKEEKKAEQKIEGAVEDYDEAPIVIKHGAIQYPGELKENNIEGDVWIKGIVNREGKFDMGSIVFIKVFLYQDGDAENKITNETMIERIKEAVLTALTGYEFTPAKKDGEAVRAYISIPFKFRLNS